MNKVKSVLFATGISLALVFTFGCSSSDDSGGGNSGNSLVVAVSSSSVVISNHSSASESMKYCVYQEMRQCFETYQARCPAGGELSDFCPYGSSSSTVASSSSSMPSSSSSIPSSSSVENLSSAVSSSSSIPSSSSSIPSSSSVENLSSAVSSSSSVPSSSSSSQYSSSSALLEYSYCVFDADKICLSGTLTACPPGGTLSNTCYYSNSSSSFISSSAISSSSSMPSSSSVASSSSFSITYTLTCANVPTSALSGVAITAPTVTCTSSNGTSSTVVSSDLNWRNAPTWNKPVAGTYNTVIVEANSGNCRGKSAICGGTLTIQMNYGTPVTYEGKTYQTVVIGTQTWMTENLNYAVNGSKCYGNDEANCATYGRLYSWTTAMALPYSCNSSHCASNLSAKYRGICPEGWHIPRNEDWDNLLQVNRYISWLNNGYGFPVLLGGRGVYDGTFDDVGYSGWWWSATEGGTAQLAYSMKTSLYSDELTSVAYNVKENVFYSVRCLKD